MHTKHLQRSAARTTVNTSPHTTVHTSHTSHKAQPARAPTRDTHIAHGISSVPVVAVGWRLFRLHSSAQQPAGPNERRRNLARVSRTRIRNPNKNDAPASTKSHERQRTGRAAAPSVAGERVPARGARCHSRVEARTADRRRQSRRPEPRPATACGGSCHRARSQRMTGLDAFCTFSCDSSVFDENPVPSTRRLMMSFSFNLGPGRGVFTWACCSGVVGPAGAATWRLRGGYVAGFLAARGGFLAATWRPGGLWRSRTRSGHRVGARLVGGSVKGSSMSFLIKSCGRGAGRMCNGRV